VLLQTDETYVSFEAKTNSTFEGGDARVSHKSVFFLSISVPASIAIPEPS